MQSRFSALLVDEGGATAIEYGLIAALIAVGIIVSMNNFTASVQTMYQKVDSAVRPAGTTSV